MKVTKFDKMRQQLAEAQQKIAMLESVLSAVKQDESTALNACYALQSLIEDRQKHRCDAVPTEVTEAARVAIEAMLEEYNYPANPSNAARAGWRACRLHIAAMKGAA